MSINHLQKIDEPYAVDLDILHKVSGLPRIGEDAAEVVLAIDARAEEIYKEYGTRPETRGVVTSEINDPFIRFATQLLACKLIRKCRKD